MKNYEELAGASGRRIFYRAERYRARDLFKRAAPDLSLDHVICRLHDVSMNGLGAYAPRGSNDLRGVGERLAIRIGVRGATLHEGMGEISRLEPTPFGTKVGVRLVDRCLNISQLVARYDEAFIRAEIDDMMAGCEERILPRWRALWHRGNQLVVPIMEDAASLRATKRLTELLVTPELVGGPIWRRSYEKPLGYPGDFQVMEMIYAQRREGESLADQLMHRIGTATAECVTTRMIMIRRLIAETMLERAPAHVHVTSLGSGTAREIVDYLQLRNLPAPIKFNLIDQDHAALSRVYEQTYGDVVRLKGGAQVSCLHASFSQFLKARELFGVLPPQDLIYSLGLIDYLSPPRARALIEALYAHLVPGGTLVIGNLNDSPTSTCWPMEFVCDWSANYRGTREMVDLAANLPDGTITTTIDPTECVCFLTVRKPAVG